jgi:multidrug efflux pump subunit AcrA (membrane-fusion protein)
MRALGLLAFLVATLLCSACGPDSPPAAASRSAPTAPTDPPREVTTAIASETPWPRTLLTTGELVAQDVATISVKVPGRLVQLDVDIGTPVKRSDVLGRIDPRDYELRRQSAGAALQAARARLGLPLEGDDDIVVPEDAALVRLARAQLDDAVRTRDRLVEVAPSGAASRAELETADSNVLVAEARLRDAVEEVQNRRAQLAEKRVTLAIAEQELGDTRVEAPFDGVVRERLASLGDFLVAGAPVVTLVRVDPLRLRFEVPERDAPRVRIGQTVRAGITGEEDAREGVIARASPAITASNRTLLLEAKLANPSGELRPGSFARIEIVVAPDERALTIPLDALVSFAGIDKVFVVADGKAVEKPVTTGRRDAARVEILDGLDPGAEVVRAPGNLQSGALVRPAR